MSRGLRDLLDVKRNKRKQGYAFRGTVEECEVRRFCVEENVAYEDFIRTKLSTEILYQHSQLFDVYDTA